MTTEILDGYAELCPWTNRGVAAEARAAATRRGLTGERLEAAVEARVVAAAAAAGDAGTEVAWLITVAAQLPRLPGGERGKWGTTALSAGLMGRRL